MCDVCMHMYVNVQEEARGSCLVSFSITVYLNSLRQLLTETARLVISKSP